MGGSSLACEELLEHGEAGVSLLVDGLEVCSAEHTVWGGRLLSDATNKPVIKHSYIIEVNTCNYMVTS